MSAKKPLALVILDGYGYREDNQDNAIANANTALDGLIANQPNTLITASGLDVGLPDGQMGNLWSGSHQHWCRSKWYTKI